MTSSFLEVFGNSPMNKVLAFLVVHEDFDYSMTDIAKHSGVGYATLKLFWNKLEENNIVIQTRVVGKAKMYELNLKNHVVKKWPIPSSQASGSGLQIVQRTIYAFCAGQGIKIHFAILMTSWDIFFWSNEDTLHC